MAESISGTISANAKKRLGSQVSHKRRSAVTKRHARLRKKVRGTAERPRLAVKRSSRHIVVQLIDDLAGHTLASASSLEADVRGLDGDKKARAAVDLNVHPGWHGDGHLPDTGHGSYPLTRRRRGLPRPRRSSSPAGRSVDRWTSR